MEGIDIQTLVRQAIQEYATSEQAKSEPAYKAELLDERKRREALERRLNELVEENKRSRKVAEEAERSSAVRAELHRLGVSKVDLAFKAVQDGIVRTEDGRLVARVESGEVPVKDYLASFVTENPEFLPARIAGGTGMTGTLKAPSSTARDTVDLERIRPGMSAEEMQRVREEIVRVASQTLRGI
jgi:methylphosphotriester-DNA--protein-cysteine methyltransferase